MSIKTCGCVTKDGKTTQYCQLHTREMELKKVIDDARSELNKISWQLETIPMV